MALRCSELNHGSVLLRRLSAMYKDGRFSDVSLKIGRERTLRAHRVVLASFSPYFEALLGDNWKEGKEDEIEILGLHGTTVSDLIEYAYSGHITVSKDNVQALLEAANFLGVELVKQSCIDFLKDSIDNETCLGIWQLADMFALKELSKVAKQHTLQHFADVCKLEEFVSLPSGFLTELLTDEELCVVHENLIPCAEEREKIVLQAVFEYIEHDKENRRCLLPKLLPLVRLSTLSEAHLKEIMTHRLVVDSCKQILEKAQKLKVDPIEEDSSEEKWALPRKFGNYIITWVPSEAMYFEELKRFAAEHRTYLGRLNDLDNDLYVTGMELWIQHEDGPPVVRQLKVYYNDDSRCTFRGGNLTGVATDIDHSLEHHEFHLKQNERITKVEMCTNLHKGLIRKLTFYTNKKNAHGLPKRYGPYGDDDAQDINYDSMEAPESYGFLAGVASSVTESEFRLRRRLQFVWRSYALPRYNNGGHYETPPPLPPRPTIRHVIPS